ncbi:hypothetical protein [Thiolapillus sp.]|uniref:hypothetical protein n=1 Tax=Thiolapillus sp. TaxID=2017437 RepID=UPI0025EED3B2|nr:hypothetical protein [Thiolapillus sp.]
MVSKKEYQRWLDTASNEELAERQRALLAVMDKITEGDVLDQARYYLRLTEEEMVIRELYPETRT